MQVVRLTGQEAVSEQGVGQKTAGQVTGFAGLASSYVAAGRNQNRVFCVLRVLLQMQQKQARQQRRADRLARLAGPSGGSWLWRLLRRGWVQAGYAVADHTRSALILSVFAFKVRASLRWLPRVGG